MRVDTRLLLLVMMTLVCALASLVPLTGKFPPQAGWLSAVFIVCGLISSFALGKHFGEGAR